jgi:predicted lipoprotein with Yx(FWY)xxD motif
MRSRGIVVLCSVATLTGFMGVGFGAHAASGATPALSTAPGIMLMDVADKDNRPLWSYFGTPSGKALYTSDVEGDGGKRSCVGQCAREFSPYLAPAGAVASGEWSLVPVGPRQQWVYNGRPLFVFNGADPRANTFVYYADADKPQVLDPEMMDPGSKLFSPRPGWRRAAFRPEQSIPVPPDIRLQTIPVANGYGFVNKNTGMSLYILRTQPKNPRAWTPMYAPDLASSVGDFSIFVRKDGKGQWAYKGQALYSYTGDYAANELNGLAAQSDARPALVYQNFLPRSVQIAFPRFHNPILVTSAGLTLYGQSVGANFGYASSTVATRGCVGDCLRMWTPLLAAPRDVASGFWTIQDRSDGSRQWAYKGGPLYTYIGDKRPGDMNGDNKQDIVYGAADGSNYDEVTLAGGNRGPDFRPYAGAGFHWHVIGFGQTASGF